MKWNVHCGLQSSLGVLVGSVVVEDAPSSAKPRSARPSTPMLNFAPRQASLKCDVQMCVGIYYLLTMLRHASRMSPVSVSHLTRADHMGPRCRCAPFVARSPWPRHAVRVRSRIDSAAGNKAVVDRGGTTARSGAHVTRRTRITTSRSR